MWSTPPVWMSKWLPRYCIDITEHSRCQPGAPRPQGESHSIWRFSPGADVRQTAKSLALRLPSTSSTRAPPRWRPGRAWPACRTGVSGRVEVKARRQRVAPAASIEYLRERDHLCDVIGGLAPDVWLDDPEPRQVPLELAGVLRRDRPGVRVLAAGREFELVLALVSVGGQMADVGDVDDMPDLESLPGQGPLECVGEDIGPHVADVLVGVDRRSARVHAHMRRVQRDEVGDLPGQGAEQSDGRPVGVASHGAPPYRRA